MGRKSAGGAGWVVLAFIGFAFAKCGDTKTPTSLPAPPATTALYSSAPSGNIPAAAKTPTPSTSPAPIILNSAASSPAPVSPHSPASQGSALRPIQRSVYVTGKDVPLRISPDGKAKILDRLPTGMEVGELARRDGWVEVRHPVKAIEGWVSVRRLTTARPSTNRDEEDEPKPKKPSKIDVLSDAAIIARLIALDAASYSGNCRCPENTDRAGRRCGARSAHSRAGGYAPLCYPSDVSREAIVAFRAHGER